MPTFQKFMYFDSPKLMNFCFSVDLQGSMPHVGQSGTGLGVFVSNFGDPL
jgi:hypothetical protein